MGEDGKYFLYPNHIKEECTTLKFVKKKNSYLQKALSW
jgi:hypothetical protein